MKIKNLLLIITTFVIAIIMNGCAKKAPEGVIATVNKQDIEQKTFEREYDIYKNLYVNQLGEDVLRQVGADGKLFVDSLKDEVLAKLILEEIILQDAKKEAIKVKDEEVEKHIKTRKKSMGGEEKLNEFLKSVEMDEEYFRESTKRDLILEKHKDKFIEKIDLKDKEVKEFFNKNKENLTIIKARHILLENKEKAEEVLEKLKNGEDFSKLAIDSSQDTNTAKLGGELGYFSRGHNSKEFDEVVFSLKEGDISPVIQTETGYHIVELQEKKDTFESLKPELTGLIKENKYNEYIEKLERKSKTKRYLDDIDKDRKNKKNSKKKNKN